MSFGCSKRFKNSSINTTPNEELGSKPPSVEINQPTWITPEMWNKNFIRMTTPNSNGNLLTGSRIRGNRMTMTPPTGGDCTTSNDTNCLQSWHSDGSNLYEAEPTWKTSFSLSYEVNDGNCGDRPLTVQVAGSSDEDTNYDFNQGLIKNTNKQFPARCVLSCKNGCPYKDSYVCTFTNGQLFTQPNRELALKDPGCRWINQDTIKDCCLLPKGSVDESTLQCFPNYVPGEQGYCVEYMTNYCSGNWISQPDCNYYIKNYIANYSDVSKVINDTIVNYVNSDSRTPHDYVSSRDSTDPFFTETIPFLCGTVPGSGNNVLGQLCAQFTRDDLKNDFTLQKMCGCFLSDGSPPPDAGLQLTNPPAPNQYIYTSITRPCDPLCRYANTIPFATGSADNWTPEQCTSTLCMLSDVSSTQINSQGDFNISLFCGSCPGGACTCVFDDVTINSINSQGIINIEQNCGQCFSVKAGDPASSPTPISCSTLSPTGGEDFRSWWESIKRFIASEKLPILIVCGIISLILGGVAGALWWTKK